MSRTKRAVPMILAAVCIFALFSLCLPAAASADELGQQPITKVLATTSTVPVASQNAYDITGATSTSGAYFYGISWYDSAGQYISGAFTTDYATVNIRLDAAPGYYFADGLAAYLNNSPVDYMIYDGGSYIMLSRTYAPEVWAPTVIKHPGGETVDEGGWCSFVATASGADKCEWHIRDANGQYGDEDFLIVGLDSRAGDNANMGAGDLAVVSMDDDWCRAVAVRCAQRGLRVCELSIDRELGGRDAAFVRGDRLVVRLDGVEHDLGSADNLKIRGSHNWENALAASALALFVGVGEDVVARGLTSFSPIEHRIEPCGEVAGVHFVNDSKATNTDSVEKALTAFTPKSVVVLLGGHDKGTDLGSLAAACCREARVAVCFGAAGPRIVRALEDEIAATGSDLRVVSAEHLRDAFDAAVAAAEPGNTVLLSPACSSFDEFSNMAERGRLFKSLVADLAPKGE